MSSTADTVPEIGSIELNQHGYRSFTLGSFAFTRDEYFAQSGKISTLRHRPPHSWPPAP
jgi:hypothetical protein